MEFSVERMFGRVEGREIFKPLCRELGTPYYEREKFRFRQLPDDDLDCLFGTLIRKVMNRDDEGLKHEIDSLLNKEKSYFLYESVSGFDVCCEITSDKQFCKSFGKIVA